MRSPGGRPALTGAALAFAGVVLAVAGCSGALPLGPAPAPAPPPRHLAAAIVMEPGLSQPGPSGTPCAAGSVALTGPGVIRSAPVGTPANDPEFATMCFRPLGKPVTFTSAGVALYQQLAGGQPVPHPAGWGLSITLPAAEAAALNAVTAKIAGTKDQLATIVAGQTWGLPQVKGPLTNGEFLIAASSKSQALQFERILVPSA